AQAVVIRAGRQQAFKARRLVSDRTRRGLPIRRPRTSTTAATGPNTHSKLRSPDVSSCATNRPINRVRSRRARLAADQRRGKMLSQRLFAIAAVAFAVCPSGVHAQLLKIVEVNAPKVNCVFQTDCIIPVSDTIGNISFPFLAPGTAWLQSRTFAGEAGAPGAGTTGYEYRVSMTQASGPGCISGF